MKKTSNNDTHKILNSLDGLQRAQTSPYFYSKLITRMQQEQLPATGSFLSAFRPALVIGVLVVLVMMNVLLLLSQSNNLSSVSAGASTGNYTVQAFSEEYNLNTSNDY